MSRAAISRPDVARTPLGARSSSQVDVRASKAQPVQATPFKVLASPAPINYPGTPLAADDLVKRLPVWTEKLLNTLKVTEPKTTIVSETTTTGVSTTVSTTEAAIKPVVFERTSLTPEASISYLRLGLDIDVFTENLRGWFSKYVMKPLAKDIEEVNDAFAKNNLDHLNCFHPASFSTSLFGTSSATNGTVMKSLVSISPQSSSQPQSLMDLAQRMKDDPLVQKRLCIEKYLAFASIPSRRNYVISRIKSMAEGYLLASFSPSSGLDSDTEILLTLFCTFLDANLPSSDYFDSQPFSGKHFVRQGEKPSQRQDAIQIAQVGPQTFELIADEHIFMSFPGPNNFFHTIVFMIEYVHGHREGFLGIGNFGSRSLNLLSVLEN